MNVPISEDPQALSGQLAADPTGLVIGSDDRRTRSFDAATGRLQWATDPLGDPGAAGDAAATANGRAFICYGSQVYALDETTGAVLWQRPSNNGSLVVANGLLYRPILDPAAQTAAQTAVDAATGELRATFLNTSTSFAEPIVADGIIYFPGLGSADVYGLPLPGLATPSCELPSAGNDTAAARSRTLHVQASTAVGWAVRR